jgi:hypothetical protein
MFIYTDNVLVSNEQYLYDSHFQEAFSNGRHQFYITNHRTKDFRRFRLKQETDEMYIFTSEDDILAFIFKKLTNN